MREYRHHASDATIEALRRLRRAWAGYRLAGDTLHVALEDGGAVAIRAEGAAVEPQLEAFRLAAELTDASGDAPASALEPPGAFAAGANDVVVFRSESWIEAPPAGGTAAGDGAGADTVVQFTGAPLQRSASAVAVCTVDDAVVVATTAGTGLLVRCGLRPHALEVTTDAAAIARFLVERRYAPEPSDG